jgi:selenide,water dikinase
MASEKAVAQAFYDANLMPKFNDIPSVDAETLLAEVTEKRSDLLLVDVRSPEEQNVSGLPGATTAKKFFRDPEMSRGKSVVCYCGIGGRSGAFVKEAIQAAGTEPPWLSIRNFELSTIGWCHAGGTLVNAAGEATTKVHGWNAKFAAMYPASYEVVVEPAPTNTEWQECVVLVGGGHAHAQVIKEYNRVNCPRWVKVVLIDTVKSASYSGMMPGCVAEQYAPEQTKIHLEPLAEWAGISYFNASVVDIDTSTKMLYLGPSPYTGEASLPEGVPKCLHYDVVSFDIGCRTAYTDTTGVDEFAIATRPIHMLVNRIDEKVKALTGSTVNLVVCGSGAAGIELAMTTAARVKKAGKIVSTVILDSQAELLAGDAPTVKKAVHKMVSDRGIQVLHGSRVESVGATEVTLVGGKTLPSDITIWATGAASHKVAAKLEAAGLAMSPKGWIRVSSTLQSITHPGIFAAGDCCTFEHLAQQPGKAGVYAVRTGPILIKNLLGFLRGEDLQDYTPQPEFLRLFNCGDGYGLGIRFDVPMYGPWVWEWKDFIDQWFMNLFKKENLPDLSTVKGTDSSQFDAALRSSESNAPTDPAAAATVLTSEDADLKVVKDIINRMNGDEAYRDQVVQFCGDKCYGNS